MDIYVGWRCSTIVREDLTVRFVCWGRAMGTNLSRTMVSSCLARGNPRLRVVVMSCCWCRLEPPLMVVFPCVCGFGCGGLLSFLEFSAPFFVDLFPWTS